MLACLCPINLKRFLKKALEESWLPFKKKTKKVSLLRPHGFSADKFKFN